MQQMEAKTATTGAERSRVASVVQTLARLHGRGESLAEIAHDARNMVTALGLYCELLDRPGVLAPEFAHFGAELRLVATASGRLVEKLQALDGPAGWHPGCWGGQADPPEPRRSGAAARLAAGALRLDLTAAAPVINVAAELLATRNLLAALAGPGIALTVDAQGGAWPARISAEDLTRVLVNLVKNAVEAMPGGGRIQITLREQARDGRDAARWLILSVEDNGPGIAEEALERVFESGYSFHAPVEPVAGGPAPVHRGLGLAICRSLVEAAGGRIFAGNRALGGACFTLELPAERLLPARTGRC